MKSIQRICLLGFGEVGSLIAAALANSGKYTIRVYDIKFSDANSQPSKKASMLSGITLSDSAQEASINADLIISAVTAGQTLSAATSVANSIPKSCWYLDLNSVSPKTKCKVASTINATGAYYVEAAIMSPILPDGMNSPILLSGAHALEFELVAHAMGFSGCSFFRHNPGSSAALKMCRSVIIKGMESLILESLLTARYHKVDAEVLESLQNIMPGIDWHTQADYMIQRSVKHGQRRSEEMKEAARTVAEVGLRTKMSLECANSQRWVANIGHSTPSTISEPDNTNKDYSTLLDSIQRYIDGPQNAGQESTT